MLEIQRVGQLFVPRYSSSLFHSSEIYVSVFTFPGVRANPNGVVHADEYVLSQQRTSNQLIKFRDVLPSPRPASAASQLNAPMCSL